MDKPISDRPMHMWFGGKDLPNWNAVTDLANELDRISRVDSISTGSDSLAAKSNAFFAIGLGAQVAQHEGIEEGTLTIMGIDENKRLLTKAKDYGEWTIYMQAYIAGRAAINIGERMPSSLPAPLQTLITHADIASDESIERSIERHRDEGKSIPPVNSVIAIIREQFHKVGDPFPEHLYDTIRMFYYSPGDPKFFQRDPSDKGPQL